MYYVYQTDNVEETAIKISQWPKASGTWRKWITVITQGADPVIVAGDGKVKLFPLILLPKDKLVDTNGAGMSHLILFSWSFHSWNANIIFECPWLEFHAILSWIPFSHKVLVFLSWFFENKLHMIVSPWYIYWCFFLGIIWYCHPLKQLGHITCSWRLKTCYPWLV